MSKANAILNHYGNTRKRLMRITELGDEIEILKVALYEPSTAKIKEEHELSQGGFSNAYKTPKLAQMERMTEVELEYNKLRKLHNDLMEAIPKMEEEIGYSVIWCYVEKSRTLADRSRCLGIHRTTLHRNILSEIERVFNL